MNVAQTKYDLLGSIATHEKDNNSKFKYEHNYKCVLVNHFYHPLLTLYIASYRIND